MPFQPINFLNAPVAESPFKDLSKTLAEGYKAGQLPAKMRRDARKEDLANQFAQMKLQNEPEQADLRTQLLREQLKNYRKPAYSGQSVYQLQQMRDAIKKDDPMANQKRQEINAAIDKATTRGQGGALTLDEKIDVVRKQGKINTPLGQDLLKRQQNERLQSEAKTDRYNKLNETQWYRMKPTSEKKRIDAILNGIGVDPLQQQDMLANSKSMEDIAEKMGVDLNNVVPVYALEGENIKQLQSRGAFNAELGELNKLLSPALGEYSNRVAGISPAQVKDAIQGKNKDKQARFLAAAALQPELAALRLNTARSRVGIEGIKELSSKSLGRARTFESLVDKEVYEKMQDYMNEWLSQAGDAYDQHMLGYSKVRKNTQSDDEEQKATQVMQKALKERNPNRNKAKIDLSAVKMPELE